MAMKVSVATRGHGKLWCMEMSTPEMDHARRLCPAAFYRPNRAAPDEWIRRMGGSPGTRSDGDRPWFEDEAYMRVGIGGNRAGKTTKLILETGAICLGMRLWYSPQNEWHTRHLWTEAAKRRGYARMRYIVPSYEQHLSEVIKELEAWYPRKTGLWWVESKTSQGTPRSIRWVNGSELIFMSHHMEQSDFEGVEQDVVAFDEPPPEWMFSRLLRGLVSTGGWVIMGCTLLDASGWFWDSVVANSANTDRITVTWHSIWDNASENGGCSSQTVQSILDFLDFAVSSPDERLAREHGFPMHVGGLVLSGWDQSTVIDPFELPRDATIIASIDPAGTRPMAGLYVAFLELPDGGWEGHVFDEVFMTSTNDLPAFSEEMNRKEHGQSWPTHPSKSVYVLIDPAAEAVQKADHAGRSLRRIFFEDYKIQTVLADKTNKLTRLLQLNARVKEKKYRVWRNCKRLMAERKRWTWDPKSTKLTKGPDDMCDNFTYIDNSGPEAAMLYKRTGGIYVPSHYRNGGPTRVAIPKEGGSVRIG